MVQNLKVHPAGYVQVTNTEIYEFSAQLGFAVLPYRSVGLPAAILGVIVHGNIKEKCLP